MTIFFLKASLLIQKIDFLKFIVDYFLLPKAIKFVETVPKVTVHHQDFNKNHSAVTTLERQNNRTLTLK